MAKARKSPADRYRDIFGGRGTIARLAKALDYDRTHLGRILAGDLPMPEHMVAVLEFLEIVPPGQWPERWKHHEG